MNRMTAKSQAERHPRLAYDCSIIVTPQAREKLACEGRGKLPTFVVYRTHGGFVRRNLVDLWMRATETTPAALAERAAELTVRAHGNIGHRYRLEQAVVVIVTADMADFDAHFTDWE
jgi:hypothetical protein